MRLSELKEGQKAVIVKILGRGAFRKRLIEMGFVKGKEISLTKFAPLKDPIEYNLLGYEVSLRKSEAELVEIATKSDIIKEIETFSNGSFDALKNSWKQKAIEKSKLINIALVGNPNCGKTTLFNFASGANEHVGNYGGVTVDAKEGIFFKNKYTFRVVDLPGTYSLSAFSPEELYVRKHITEEMPDIVVNVVDASNLERNLYLTSQLIDLDVKVVIALNVYDELLKKKAELDVAMLSELIGIPIIPTVAAKGKGIEKLFEKVIDAYEDLAPCLRHIHINYGKELENAIKSIQKKIKKPANLWLTNKTSSRFLAIKLLEDDSDANKVVSKCKNANQIIRVQENQIKKVESFLKSDLESLVSDARYGFVSGALKETYTEGSVDRFKRSKFIDSMITHRIWGFPIFLLFLFVMFVSTFKLGQYPMDWIDWLVQQTALLFNNFMSDGMLKDLIVDGIINGMGAVIVFLPNILILFLFISLMEDTGYMARVAFIMDKLMHKIGLHGKSVIPMLMGFGCNVPAIMSTRTIENRSDRLLTMLINPFMSCSARLPIYLVIIGSVFSAYHGVILFGIYITGILVAIVMSIIFKKTLFKSKESPFVMELPPYRMPTFRVIVKHMWNKTRSYLKKMGGIILVASIIVWALGYFPLNKNINEIYSEKINEISEKYEQKINISPISEKNLLQSERDQIVKQLNMESIAKHQEKSYIGMSGKIFEPLLRPLGFDWKMTVAIISGTPAKEIVVSTLGVLYQTENAGNLKMALKKSRYESGKNKGKLIFTPPVALAFLIFILLYFPCIATIVAVKNESGSWKWALFMVAYTTALAWLAAFFVYQIGCLIM
ncbi:MAG: ferrous iron transport protein B [Bacteroidota bacterium]|nr:ferrous iron transport protein B [Bacteroidota bacterium]